MGLILKDNLERGDHGMKMGEMQHPAWAVERGTEKMTGSRIPKGDGE